MIQINIQNRGVSPDRLEALKQELAEIGVNSFSFDYESYMITLIRHCPLGECDVRCALEKAGFKDMGLEINTSPCTTRCVRKNILTNNKNN
ncbi:hypothetical protein LAG90_07155 [Marinilongibacter aquaticus]|uniref:hypothetical protein n=1 Tax=Marinilongibacter aquaticus TaxID=2975157 RepID=UPI0021BDD885|nr:hypothetical protein [Marinilongibacter aquaticus]UBM60421.1 hypothetical protein LAG90_07155 [Marinilongibacter aquaticus]